MKEKFDFIKFVNQQHAFSQKTFGPGQRVEGVLNHIGKEIKEVEKKPNDVSEWCDIVILAIDGALRQGFSAEEIAQALQAKLEKNMGRQWPDWRTLPEDSPIEHVKTKEADISEKVYLPTNWENGFVYFETLEELTESVQPNDNNEFEYHEANIIFYNLVKELDFDFLAERVIEDMYSNIDGSDYSFEGCDERFEDEAKSFGLERKLSSAIGLVMNSFPPIRSYHFENISELKALKAKDPA